MGSTLTPRPPTATFLEQYWWFILVSGGLAFWIWRAARKFSPENMEAIEQAARARRAQDPTPAPLRAEAVAARFEALRREGRPVLGIAIAALLCAALFVLPALVPGVTTKGAIYIVAFVAFGILSLWRLRQLRMVREIGVTCPLCNEEQVPSLLYTGRCPKCDAWLLHPNELGQAPAPLITTGSPLRNAVGVVVLISLTGWGLYHVARVVRENREWCARRYAVARSAADSSRIRSIESCSMYRPS